MYKCPHCSCRSYSAWQKALMTPFSSIPCGLCGLHAGISFVGSFSVAVPFLMLIVGVTLAVATTEFTELWIHLLAWFSWFIAVVLTMAAWGYCFLGWLPLIRRP
jgi:hypothetical protein